VEPAEPGVVYFDTRGVERLYGGVEAALRRALASVGPVWDPRVGAGERRFVALAAASVARPGQAVIVEGKDEQPFLEPLPLSLLPLPVDRYAELTARVYAAILTVSGAEVVVDSTKNPPYAYFLRRAPGVGLRVLHLVRDSRGVVHSWMKRVERPEITGDAAYFEEFSPWRAGIRWMECNLAFDVLRLRTPTARMRYEALAAEPAGEVARAMRTLGEEVDVSALADGSVEVAGQHSVRGNPMRFSHGRQRVRADEAWRRDMARPVRRTVLALTWPLLWRYGYLRGRHV